MNIFLNGMTVRKKETFDEIIMMVKTKAWMHCQHMEGDDSLIIEE